MDEGFLKLYCKVYGANGTWARSTLVYTTDPGYRDTGRMLVESGICFVLNDKDIKVGGGFWTPASCQGEALITRLVDTGCILY